MAPMTALESWISQSNITLAALAAESAARNKPQPIARYEETEEPSHRLRGGFIKDEFYGRVFEDEDDHEYEEEYEDEYIERLLQWDDELAFQRARELLQALGDELTFSIAEMLEEELGGDFTFEESRSSSDWEDDEGPWERLEDGEDRDQDQEAEQDEQWVAQAGGFTFQMAENPPRRVSSMNQEDYEETGPRVRGGGITFAEEPRREKVESSQSQGKKRNAPTETLAERARREDLEEAATFIKAHECKRAKLFKRS